MKQLFFDPLDLTDQNPSLTLREACRIMRAERNAQAKRIRSEGVRCSSWTLPNQLRPYRGLGRPDGSVRPVYALNVYDDAPYRAPVLCDKCSGENDRADSGNYCTTCHSEYMVRTQSDPEYRPVGGLSPSTVDVTHETAYGRTVPASRAIRCF